MIQKISIKYFSPFTPIAELSKGKARNLERMLFSSEHLRDNKLLKDSFTKIPEIFY